MFTFLLFVCTVIVLRLFASYEVNLFKWIIVNKQLFCYWVNWDPRETHKTSKHLSSYGVVCCCGKTFIEPKVFEEDVSIISINSSDFHVSILVDLFLAPNEVGWVWSEQNGAACHTSNDTINFHWRHFPAHLISPRGDIPWPNTFPYLSSCYIISCGLSERKISLWKPTNPSQDAKRTIVQYWTTASLNRGVEKSKAKLHQNILRILLNRWTQQRDVVFFTELNNTSPIWY